MNFSAQKRRSPEILFAYEIMLNLLIFIFSFWGVKISLSLRTMSLLLADVVSKPIISPRVFAALFYFAAKATFFDGNWCSLFL